MDFISSTIMVFDTFGTPLKIRKHRIFSNTSMRWDKKYRKVDDDDRIGLKLGSVLVHCGAGVSRVLFPFISSLQLLSSPIS